MQRGQLSTLYLKLVALLFLFIGCLSVNAADWQPELVASTNADYREPDEAFRIYIPSEVPIEELKNLALELDNIDITAMVSRDGDYAVYQSTQPLATGFHQLRVVEYLSDGSIKELATWRFDIRQSKLFRQYAFAANTQLSVNQRIADNNLSQNTPSRLQGQGSAQIAYAAANGEWHTDGQIDLLYNSLNNNGRDFNSGEFLFSAGNTYMDARIGHQTVGSTSLIMNNFRRRGISLEGRLPTINTKISGFALASDDIIGFQRGLGVGDSRQRVDGITFDSSPFTEIPQKFHISATWLNGKGRDSAGLVASDSATLDASVSALESGLAKGSAWSVSVDSLLFDDKLQLRGEYAGTDYNSNTTDGLASESDNAYSLLAMLIDTTASGLNWNIGVENSEIGTFFKSLANKALPSDQWRLHTFTGIQWSNFGLQGDYQKLKDNVNNLTELPEIETDIESVSANWAPTLATTDGWLGSPSLNAIYSHQTQDQNSTPAGYLLAKTDNKLNNLQANAIFSYPSFNWGLGFAESKFRDHSKLQHNTDTHGININSNMLLLNQRLTLAPSVQYNQIEDLTSNEDSTAIIYGLQSVMVFKPEKLDGSFDISVNHNFTTDQLISNNTLAVNMALNWHLVQAKRNNFGFDMGLSGMYNDLNDHVTRTNTLNTYQVFLTFSAVLPSRAGQAQ